MRYIAVVFASFTLGFGVAGASASAGASHQALAKRHGWMAPDANPKHPWMYVAGGFQNIIAIYDLAKVGTPQIGEISEGLNKPAGLAVDGRGTLYAANYDQNVPGGGVTIYPAGSTHPSLTLSQGLNVPIDVAVDYGGNVWVLNRGSTPSIVVFPPGQTIPSQTITSSLIQVPTQAVFDAAQNLYLGDNVTGVSEIPSGSTQPASLGLQVPGPSGITLDPFNGNLFVSAYQGPQKVFVFAPGQEEATRKLNLTVTACFLASGVLNMHEYIFVPDCDTSGDVWLFKQDSNKPLAMWDFTAAGGAAAIAFKPAGVP